ncbi:MAG: TOBE domain-containing protein, partial [Anaerohalosphaeraceae bacterium]
DPSIKSGEKAYLMARPEAIKLQNLNEKKNGEIVSTIYLGSTVEYELEVDGMNLLAVDASPQYDQLLSEGKKVGIYIDPERSYILPYDGYV